MARATDPWEEFRACMPVAKRFAYMDHAAVAPLPASTGAAIETWLRQATELGDTAWPEWERRVTAIRRTVAELIGSSPEELALIPNTTSGINLVAEGFPWHEGDNVVTLANEFPSNLYPWLNLGRRGVETRRVSVEQAEVDVERLFAACDTRTRIISVSWVGYATGWRIDLEAIILRAHERGILVFLDAIQGLGVFPIHVTRLGLDFLAADGHKWMLGPEGAGIFYVRREHLDLLRPLNVGWHSVVHSHDYARCELNLRPEAARYEGGSQNMVGFLGLGASLDLLARFGLTAEYSPIAERVVALNRIAAERLQAIGAVIKSRLEPRHASGILSFDLPGRDLRAVRKRCLEADVVLSLRNGWLRISPHAYCDEDDIERLIEAIQRACGR